MINSTIFLNKKKNPDYLLNSVFNEDSIYDVYAKVSKDLLSFVNMELGVLQAFSYCLYELADNVLNHSGETTGNLQVQYFDKDYSLNVDVIDNGIGIWKSLSNTVKYSSVREDEALKNCIEDGVTDGKGRGFGLYSTSLLIKNTDSFMSILSGHYTLFYTKKETLVSKSNFYHGTKVHLEINTNIDMPANKILADRADGENEFNECFLMVSPFNNLW